MKTIEERAKEYAPDPFDPDYILPAREGYIVKEQRNAYIAGATAQKAIDEEVRLKKCDNMTEAEYNRETAFASWYLENGRSTPTYSDTIEWTTISMLWFIIIKHNEWVDELKDCIDILIDRLNETIEEAEKELQNPQKQ